MRVIDHSFSLEAPSIEHFPQLISLVERAGRTCYKSEDKISEDSAESFVGRIVGSGHESVIEHANVSLRIVCDRGVSHELVRHRLAAYSQESTRYCNYAQDRFGNEITVIRPVWYPWQYIRAASKGSTIRDVEMDLDLFSRAVSWYDACQTLESLYMDMLISGASPQEARAILPNSLKTELVMTANLREWRHVFNMRCQRAAHPQIRDLFLQILEFFNSQLPVLFSDQHKRFLQQCSCGGGDACSVCARA